MRCVGWDRVCAMNQVCDIGGREVYVVVRDWVAGFVCVLRLGGFGKTGGEGSTFATGLVLDIEYLVGTSRKVGIDASTDIRVDCESYPILSYPTL